MWEHRYSLLTWQLQLAVWALAAIVPRDCYANEFGASNPERKAAIITHSFQMKKAGIKNLSKLHSAWLFELRFEPTQTAP